MIHFGRHRDGAGATNDVELQQPELHCHCEEPNIPCLHEAHRDPISHCACDDFVRGGQDDLLPYDRELCGHLHESSLHIYFGVASS